MNTLNRVIFLFSFFIIVSCGGGGGGGGGDDSSGYNTGTPSNSPPSINNSTLNVSVQENQTSAFAITASDPDGDTLTFSLGGTDASLFSVSSSGVVTFNTAPDFENPSDSNSDNVYEIQAVVTDGFNMVNADFTVTVTNDTSDDVTTVGYDGTILAMGPIQGASVCI